MHQLEGSSQPVTQQDSIGPFTLQEFAPAPAPDSQLATRAQSHQGAPGSHPGVSPQSMQAGGDVSPGSPGPAL